MKARRCAYSVRISSDRSFITCDYGTTVAPIDWSNAEMRLDLLFRMEHLAFAVLATLRYGEKALGTHWRGFLNFGGLA